MNRAARVWDGWAAAVACVAFSVSSVSRAEETSAFTFPLEGMVSRWSPPPLALNGADVPRSIVGLPVRSSSTLYGVGAAFGFLVRSNLGDGPWIFGAYQDMARFRFAWADGEGPSAQKADGVSVAVTRGTENLLELSMPVLAGAGAFVANGHWSARAGFNWGWAYLWTRGVAVEPSRSALGGSADSGSPFFRLPLAVCLLGRSFDGQGVLAQGEDACITFTPTVYEWGWFNGWSAGLRVDL